MENAILQRIKDIMKNENLNTNSFSIKINTPRTTIKSMFEKNTNPSFEQLLKIIDVFTQYSIEWLMTGEGEMLKKEQPALLKDQSGGRNINTTYRGNFTKPIHTEINSGDNATLGGSNAKSTPLTKESSDFESDLHKYKIEIDYLIKRIESLESQLGQAISDKERAMTDRDKAMSMLEKILNK